jgi:hypothetical protein
LERVPVVGYIEREITKKHGLKKKKKTKKKEEEKKKKKEEEKRARERE